MKADWFERLMTALATVLLAVVILLVGSAVLSHGLIVTVSVVVLFPAALVLVGWLCDRLGVIEWFTGGSR